MKLAIIGTAGRGDDRQKLTPAHWRMMEIIGQTVSVTLEADELVSGGAAVADHVAVSLFLRGFALKLTLYLPAAINNTHTGFIQHANSQDAGKTANYYHSLFYHLSGRDSFADFALAREKGAVFHVNPAGFKARNTQVAEAADALLAFTFSGHKEPKDGGTADTVNKFLGRRKVEEENLYAANMNGACYTPREFPAFHFDLENKILHKL